MVAETQSPGNWVKLAIIVLILTWCGCMAQSPKPASSQSQSGPFQLVIPKNLWEPLFFQAINERASIAELSTLRSELPKDDLEVRIWHGFGVTNLEGFVLRRRAGNWSAIHLDGIHPALPKAQYQRQLRVPKSGWSTCWTRLVELGILELPDVYEIQCAPMVNDGMSYVVEFNHGNVYRTYLYENPSYAKCEQAKRMISIGNFVAEEFDLPEMRTDSEP
jgi:hypothetical protein